MGGCFFRNIIPSFVSKFCRGKVYQNVVEEKRRIVPKHIEPGFYATIVDKVEANYNKIRERLGAQAFEYNGIYVSVDTIIEKVAVHFFEN